MLEVQEYRSSILAGLVLSVSSRTDSTVSLKISSLNKIADRLQQRPVSQSLVAYAQTLPIESVNGGYDLRGLASDLLAQVRGNLTSNNIVIPVLQTFNVLFEADAFEALFDNTEGIKR